VLADVSDRDYNLDPEAVAAAVTPRTRVVVPVHLYGQMADMVRLLADAQRRGLHVVEDACQAHGARRDGLGAGEGGQAGAFSFYPAKNLGAFGDAGALVTGDERLAARARALREHGQTAKHCHETVGYTARLDTVQAVVLLRKLPLLSAWTEERRAIAGAYSEALEGVGDLRLPPVPPGSRPVWHLYEIRTGRADELAAFLSERGIQTGRHYPSPVHLTPAFAHLGYGPGAFPVSEALALELVSLPIYPGLGNDRLWAVVTAIREFFEHD
jgi:dTDP-4-amino-4,6-dideoxygalactose transaminase